MIITLTTDFGTRDGYVGAMKGRILELHREAIVVDISHDIEAQDIRGGAMCIARASQTFPDGTLHIVVVDPGVGSRRCALLVDSGGQWFVAPDNGVLGPVILGNPSAQVYRLRRETEWWTPHPTFDGLAVFAPAAACVANGIETSRLAEPTEEWIQLVIPQARQEDGGWVGEILQFDRFGNAITCISGADVGSAAACSGHDFPLRTHYADVSAGTPLGIVNSDGLLELAVRDGSAQDQLGLSVGDPVRSA